MARLGAFLSFFLRFFLGLAGDVTSESALAFFFMVAGMCCLVYYGLTIEIVTTEAQLIDFERSTWIGFEESDDAPIGREPFSQHHNATLHDTGMTYINGRLNGDVVSSIIIHKTEDAAGIYGVSTLPEHRRRGYATALVHAATALHPELPVVVQPDPPSVPMYTRIGFMVGGEIAMWRKG